MKDTIITITAVLISFTSLAQNPFQEYIQNVPDEFNFTSNNVVYAVDIPYDTIDAVQQSFNLFIPDISGPSPLVIFVHGGGFTSGDKLAAYSSASGRQTVEYFLDQGIAFATIGYRLIINDGAPETIGVNKSLYDVKRALQFIRYYAEDLYIDPEHIVMKGVSAGAGTSFWLAVHDDMADPESPDPALRESTRICAAGISNSQATYDLLRWESDVFYDYDGMGGEFTTEEMISLLSYYRYSNFYGGIDSIYEPLYNPELISYREDCDMLAMFSSDDPPIYNKNTNVNGEPSSDPLHHPVHAKTITDYAIASGIDGYINYIPAFSLDNTEGQTMDEFLAEKAIEGCEEEVTNINYGSKKNVISLFPNPAKDYLNICINGKKPEAFDINIYDISGRLKLVLSSDDISGKNSLQIDISIFESGLYFLKLRQVGKSKSFKFVVE